MIAYLADTALWAGVLAAGAAVCRGAYEVWKETLPWIR